MSRRRQGFAVALAVVSITAVVSHLVVHELGVRTSSVSYRVTGEEWPKPMACVAGSSLLGDALNIYKIGQTLKQGMQSWFVAGGSPSEWIEFQPKSLDAKLTIVGISAYDLNEHFFCDVQASIVPLSHAIRDLYRTGSSWSFAKRVLGQYPQKYLRIVFPSIGRSQGVMGGVKERFQMLVHPGARVESDSGPRVATWDGSNTDPSRLAKISDWSHGYLLRSLAKLKSACQGRHSFDGPKRLALLRMLEQAQRQGRVIVVVLPVSPAYQEEFLDAQTTRQFEATVAEVQKSVPGVVWLRLDQLPQLNSNKLFWDVVHMNVFGQQIATEKFLSFMREHVAQP